MTGRAEGEFRQYLTRLSWTSALALRDAVPVDYSGPSPPAATATASDRAWIGDYSPC